MTMPSLERLAAANPVPSSARERLGLELALGSIKPVPETFQPNTRKRFVVAVTGIALVAAAEIGRAHV